MSKMMFYYHSQPRLSVWTDSPNLSATIAAMLLVISISIIADKNTFIKRCLFIVIPVSIIVFVISVILILTYSRGGWLAYIVGLLFLRCNNVLSNKIITLCGIGFVCGVLWIPEGLDRAGSITDPGDRSITNRIQVWEGALAMTAANPLSGVGRRQFGLQYSAWYQPSAMHTSYITAVDNYLTVSTEYGLGGLLFYLILFALPFWSAFRLAHKAQNSLILGVCASVLVFSVSAIFTCSLRSWYLNILITGCLTLLSFYVLHNKLTRNTLSSRCLFIDPALFCVLLVTLIGCTGLEFYKAWPTRTVLFHFNETHQNQKGVIIYPTGLTRSGIILYFHDKDESIIDIGKTILRPLAESGFAVISVDYDLQGRAGIADALALLNWVSRQPNLQGQPIFLYGTGLGGRICILVACRVDSNRLQGVVATDSDVDWPFPDLSPLQQIDKLSAPLLLIYSENKADCDGLNRLLSRAKNPTNIHLCITNKGELSWLSSSRFVLPFFAKNGHVSR